LGRAHGNGTQDAFWTDPSVLSVSLQQEDLFPPASGTVEETGEGARPERATGL
jgi:acetoin utilization deacetylase AcuC-like enzyme